MAGRVVAMTENTALSPQLLRVVRGEPTGGTREFRGDVVATAKRDLRAGEVLDGYGHFMTYGEAASVAETRQHRYLPMGLVEGCRLRRDVPQDQALTYDDIELPGGRVADELYEEQCRMFGTVA